MVIENKVCLHTRYTLNTPKVHLLFKQYQIHRLWSTTISELSWEQNKSCCLNIYKYYVFCIYWRAHDAALLILLRFNYDGSLLKLKMTVKMHQKELILQIQLCNIIKNQYFTLISNSRHSTRGCQVKQNICLCILLRSCKSLSGRKLIPPQFVLDEEYVWKLGIHCFTL